MTFTSNWKPSRTARKKAQRETRLKIKKHETDEKAAVRRRDKVCRFPLCGCRKLGLKNEVAHLRHKGMGGNATGDRSMAEGMIYLCEHRHQHGAISLHKGTLRVVPLTDAGTRGPVAFDVDLGETDNQAEWFRVAQEGPRENAVKVSLLEPRQWEVLTWLAQMDA